MKSDRTTHLLLGLIATGVAAMAAIAFEKRYHRQLRRLINEADDALDHAYDRISQRTTQIGRTMQQEATTLRDRIGDGVETFREKAGDLKERVAEGMERAGGQFRAGAEKLKEGFQQGVGEFKDGAEDAAGAVRQTLPPPPRI